MKNPAAQNTATNIFYCDIGDYLSREEKLAKISNLHSVLNDAFKIIAPNDKGDWINQRDDTFENFILLGDKKDNSPQTFFYNIYSNGIISNRDFWCYNFSKSELEKNIQTTIDFYNTHTPLDIDSTKFVWIEDSKQHKNRNIEYKFDASKIIENSYRPFCKQYFYYYKYLSHSFYQMPKFFSFND